MPKPGKAEGKNEFISRCVSQVHGKEGKPMNEALGQCFGIWRQHRGGKKPKGKKGK